MAGASLCLSAWGCTLASTLLLPGVLHRLIITVLVAVASTSQIVLVILNSLCELMLAVQALRVALQVHTGCIKLTYGSCILVVAPTLPTCYSGLPKPGVLSLIQTLSIQRSPRLCIGNRSPDRVPKTKPPFFPSKHSYPMPAMLVTLRNGFLIL